MKRIFYIAEHLKDDMLLVFSDQKEIVDLVESPATPTTSFEVSEECYAALPKSEEWYGLALSLGSTMIWKEVLWYTLSWNKRTGFSRDEFDNKMFRELDDAVKSELLRPVGAEILLRF